MKFDKRMLLLLLSLFVFACSKKEEKKVELLRPVKMMTLSDKKSGGRLSYPAKVAANQHVNLAFQVDGPLIELKVKAGDKVKKGDLLARLDPRDYESELKVRKAYLTEAKSDYERYKKLEKSGAVARADFEKRQRDYEIAKSKLKVAEKALKDTSLKAPFDGTIAGTFVDENQNVNAKQEILSLQDDSEIDISVNIPEQDMATSQRNIEKAKADALLQPRVVFPVAPGKEFKLEIKELQTEADPTTQTFKVTFKMPSPENIIIRAGMTAEVSVNKEYFNSEAASGFHIPGVALFIDEDGAKAVWVVKDGKVSKVKVKVGDMAEDQVSIEGDLKSGDIIVISGVNALREGMKVRPLGEIEK